MEFFLQLSLESVSYDDIFWVWRSVDSSADSNVSEEHTVSIFIPEDEDIWFQCLLETAFHYASTSYLCVLKPRN
jgi:hypothetical protein